MDFPEGHQPFAEGETKLPKKNFFSEIHHPSNDLEAKQNTSLNSPETQIFEAFVRFHIPKLPSFKIPFLSQLDGKKSELGNFYLIFQQFFNKIMAILFENLS